MATFKFGNGTVIVPVTTDNDTYIIGNGAGDAVFLEFDRGDTITLGTGAGDSVDAFRSMGDTITLGDGAGDSVDAVGFFSFHNPPFNHRTTITLGNGAGDTGTTGGR